jgi:hypothetical protein
MEVLSKMYARRFGGNPSNPATLADYMAKYATVRISEGRLGAQLTREPDKLPRRGEGVAPTPTTPEFPEFAQGTLQPLVAPVLGASPATCGGSCLSSSVSVLGTSRTIAYLPAWSGGGRVPNGNAWSEQRFLDSVDFGVFPDRDQRNLANQELQGTGCGPVAGDHLLEWWNIPVFDGANRLFDWDARVNHLAERMETLDGANYTDDDELFDALIDYPREQFRAGHIRGYPGYHWDRNDPSALKAMLNYVAQGYPVIALYATGEESLHWAMIAGYERVNGVGKVRIANATDLTLEDFYNQWDDWAALSWAADAAAGLAVDPNTFFAYTGWGNTAPARFLSRATGNGRLPSYGVVGGNLTKFRYCLPGNDEIGDESELVPYVFGDTTFDPQIQEYCFYKKSTPPVALGRLPNADVALAAGASRIVQLDPTPALRTLATDNPGVQCEFWVRHATGAWNRVQSRKCQADGALQYRFTNSGVNSDVREIQFFIHTPDFLTTSWRVNR